MSKLRDLTTVGFANIIATGISGIFWIIMARLLGTDDYGEISYFLAIASVAATISFLGFGIPLVVYTSKGVKIQPPLYFISTISSVVTSVIVFFMFYNFGVSLYIIGYVMFHLVIHEFLGRKQYNDYSKYLTLQRILLFFFGLLLFFIIGKEGIILGLALSFFPVIFKVVKTLKTKPIEFHLIKNRLGFIRNNFSVDISKVLTVQMDKLIIFPLFGLTILGNYQLGVQILSLLGILPAIIFSYLLPQESSGIQHPKLKQLGILASICLAVLAIVLAPIILPILFPQFTESISVVQIMSLAIIPITVNITYISKFLANEQSKIVLIGAIIYISIQVSGIFTLGKLYGINGMAAATVLAATLESIYLFLVDRKFNLTSTKSI